MKFMLFDGILETHLASSLERALRARGHDVINTGKLGHGFKFLTDPLQLAPIEAAIDQAIAERPDIVFVFRPASLPFAQLWRLRKSGARIVAWLSDDPVLWKLSYGPVIDHYDLVLHCGNATVLDFYEQQHGRPTGINFPFWTDGVSFPYVYGSKEPESDVMFLGNVHDQVRRDRYFRLSGMDLDLRIHGNVGSDYNNVWGGYLDADAEVADAGARTRLAINIPQYFRDHHGLETWFDGLDKLGFFEYPSRVIQYAAMGIPLISFVPEGSTLDTFPEIYCVNDSAQAEATARQLLEGGGLSELSLAMWRRFASHFSAGSRVLALEHVLANDDWRSLDAVQRTRMFTEFDGTEIERNTSGVAADAPEQPPAVGSVPTRTSRSIKAEEADEQVRNAVQAHFDSLPVAEGPLNIALIGTGWGDHVSTLNTTLRGLRNMGHHVDPVNPYNFRDFISKDPFGEYSGVVDVVGLREHFQHRTDVFLFVGGYYLPEVTGTRMLREDHGVKVLAIGLEGQDFTLRDSRLVSIVDKAGFVNQLTPQKFAAHGLENVAHYPDGFDRSYVRLLLLQKSRHRRLGIFAQREAHFGLHRRLLDEFRGIESARFAADVEGTERRGLANVSRVANSLLSIVLPDMSRKGPLPNRLLGHAMIAGSLPVLTRGIAPTVISNPGEDSILIAHPGELRLKLRRLLSDGDALDRLRLNSVSYAAANLAVEENLVEMLAQEGAQVR
ncbi:hypothetical protein [Zhihengliuella halotolerans]|nr:hypothetical protein [Zhihengliuella halotolerans]